MQLQKFAFSTTGRYMLQQGEARWFHSGVFTTVILVCRVGLSVRTARAIELDEEDKLV